MKLFISGGQGKRSDGCAWEVEEVGKNVSVEFPQVNELKLQLFDVGETLDGSSGPVAETFGVHEA